MQLGRVFRLRFCFLSVVLSLAWTPTDAAGQFDHLACMRVKDSAKFSATVLLDAAQDSFDPPGGCTVVGKAKYFCTPSSKQVLDFEIAGSPASPLDVTGPEPVPSRICYKVKCPTSDIADELVHDQFGERTLSRFKVQLLCTPAAIGPAPTTTTTTTTTLPPENCMSEMIPGQGLACYGFCAGQCGCAAGGTCFLGSGNCNVSTDCPPLADQCIGGFCSVFATSCTTNDDCEIADACACSSAACSCF